jgi:hypothetical protein
MGRNFGQKAGYTATGKEFNSKINGLELAQKKVLIPTGNFQISVEEATEDSNLTMVEIDNVTYNVAGFIKMANLSTTGVDRFDNVFLPKARICAALDSIKAENCKSVEELKEKLFSAVESQIKVWVKDGMITRLFTTTAGRNSSTMVFSSNNPTEEQLASWEKYNFFVNEELSIEGGSKDSKSLSSDIFGDLGVDTYSQGMLSFDEACKVLKGWGSTVEELSTLRKSKVGVSAKAK